MLCPGLPLFAFPCSPPEGCAAAVRAFANVSVVDDAGALTPAFSLDVLGFAEAILAVSGDAVVTGTVQYMGANLSVVASAVGDIDLSGLQVAADFIFTVVVVPYFDGMLAEGFALPMVDGVELYDSEILFGAGFAGISTNFRINLNETVSP